MSEDLIRRDDALKAIDMTMLFVSRLCLSEFKRAREYINALPTIEPKHGEWIDFKNGWKCNACEKWNSEKSKFCPNCGADMRGENNETDKEMR